MRGGGKYWCTRQAREEDGWVFLSPGMVLVLSMVEMARFSTGNLTYKSRISEVKPATLALFSDRHCCLISETRTK
jgi:hypothetical protein